MACIICFIKKVCFLLQIMTLKKNSCWGFNTVELVWSWVPKNDEAEGDALGLCN